MRKAGRLCSKRLARLSDRASDSAPSSRASLACVEGRYSDQWRPPDLDRREAEGMVSRLLHGAIDIHVSSAMAAGPGHLRHPRVHGLNEHPEPTQLYPVFDSGLQAAFGRPVCLPPIRWVGRLHGAEPDGPRSDVEAVSPRRARPVIGDQVGTGLAPSQDGAEVPMQLRLGLREEVPASYRPQVASRCAHRRPSPR